MLLPRDILPTNSLYFVGGYVISSLKENNNIKLLELYLITKEKIKVSISIFILSLDWLFLIGVVMENKEGNLEYVH